MNSGQKTLLDNLKMYDKLITKMLVWNESKEEYCVIKYDWPKSPLGYVFYTQTCLGSAEKVFKEQGTYNYIFEKLLEYCDILDTFDIEVRNEILPHPTYSYRNITGDSHILNIDGWKIIAGPIRNKHFAVSKFTYTKLQI